MEIKIVEMPAFTIVGLKYRGKNEEDEIPQLWQALMPRAQEIEAMVELPVAYGISANMDEDSGEFDYVAGFEVSRATDIPEGMVVIEVPGGRYARFTTTLPNIGETFQNAYGQWLPAVGLKPSGGPEIELYDERFDSEDPSSEFDIYIPIA